MTKGKREIKGGMEKRRKRKGNKKWRIGKEGKGRKGRDEGRRRK